MIIVEIAPEDFPQMRFSENDNVVEAIATYETDQSFTERILPRTPRCRFDFVDANRLNPLLKVFTVNPVTIAQKIPRVAAVGEGLDNLLAGPACGGMFGYVEMYDAPAIMGQNDEDKQDSEGGGGNHEKVDGNQVFDMIVQEGAPCLGRRISLLRHEPGHGPFRDLDPEFQQFPVDSRTSPSPIGIGHFTDQLADFFACSWPTGSEMFREVGSNIMQILFDATGRPFRA